MHYYSSESDDKVKQRRRCKESHHHAKSKDKRSSSSSKQSGRYEGSANSDEKSIRHQRKQPVNLPVIDKYHVRNERDKKSIQHRPNERNRIAVKKEGSEKRRRNGDDEPERHVRRKVINDNEETDNYFDYINRGDDSSSSSNDKKRSVDRINNRSKTTRQRRSSSHLSERPIEHHKPKKHYHDNLQHHHHDVRNHKSVPKNQEYHPRHYSEANFSSPEIPRNISKFDRYQNYLDNPILHSEEQLIDDDNYSDRKILRKKPATRRTEPIPPKCNDENNYKRAIDASDDRRFRNCEEKVSFVDDRTDIDPEADKLSQFPSRKCAEKLCNDNALKYDNEYRNEVNTFEPYNEPYRANTNVNDDSSISGKHFAAASFTQIASNGRDVIGRRKSLRKKYEDYRPSTVAKDNGIDENNQRKNERPRPPTMLYDDQQNSIVSTNNSIMEPPSVPVVFNRTQNLRRNCNMKRIRYWEKLHSELLFNDNKESPNRNTNVVRNQKPLVYSAKLFPWLQGSPPPPAKTTKQRTIQ